MTIGRDELSETFAEAQRNRGPSGNPGDDGRLGAGPEDATAEDGYDNAQRAEILEVESRAPLGTGGILQTDMLPDLGGGDADDGESGDAADRLDHVEDTDAPFRGPGD